MSGSSNTKSERIVRTGDTDSTAVRDNMINSGNVATFNSNNTTDNSRIYNASTQNEYKNSTIHIVNKFLSKQPTRSRENLEKIVEAEIDWDVLSGQLSVVDQDNYRSTIRLLDRNEPRFFWITKNIDFTQWESDANLPALWLSGPHDRGMEQVSSHIIGAAIKKAPPSNGSLLYFFCSTATKGRGSIATVFAHTLLHQIVTSSSADKAKSITATFLKSLLGEHIGRQHSSRFKENDSLSVSLGNILDAPDDELRRAFVEAVRTAEIQELSIIIDGIDITIPEGEVFVHTVYSLMKCIVHTNRKFKVLLTSIQNTALQNTLGMLPCTYIEYDKERMECLRSLQYDDTRYAKIVKEHHGSLEWLWNHQQYLEWSASTTSSLLYIQGKPGSGKSTLAKYFQKNLSEREPKASSATVAYYFYTFRGTRLETTHDNMLRSILYSILQQDESAFFHFQLEFRNCRRCNLSEWPYDSLKTVLSSFANQPPTNSLFLILDAMDESKEEDRYDIIQLLCRLCAANKSCVKIFLASRPVAELQHQMEKCHHVIKLQDENKDDIQKFVDDFLPILKLPGPSFREAADYINTNAEGAFVWVHLVKAELLRIRATGYNDIQIVDRLKRLPKELAKFYRLMLNRLEEEGSQQDIQYGITMFQFVLFALRPLKVVELQHVLAITSDPKPSYPEFKKILTNEPKTRIMHCGGNFLEITADNTVQLMHQTAREFFLHIEEEKPDSRFALDVKEAHRIIVVSSVGYLKLCFANLEPATEIKSWDLEDFQKYVRNLDQWPWVNYALHYLKDHHNLCNRKGTVSKLVHALIKQLTKSQVSEFLGNWMAFNFRSTKFASNFVRSMKTLVPLRLLRNQPSEDFKYKLLDTAAALRFFQVFESLLQPCTHSDVQTRGETSLIICVKKELFDASQMLIDVSENLDAKDNAGQTALHHAAEKGHEAITRLLLQQGANKMAKDNNGLIALQLAIKKGHKAVAQLLLDMGTDVSATNNNGSTPLHYASGNGHKAMAQLLLNKGPDVSVTDRDGSTLRQPGSENGHEAEARLLLDKAETDVIKLQDDNGYELDSDTEPLRSSIFSHQSSISSRSSIPTQNIPDEALAQAEDVLASNLGNNTKIYQVIRKAAEQWGEDKINSRMRHAVKDFSQDIKCYVTGGTPVLESIPTLLRSSALPIATKILRVFESNVESNGHNSENKDALHKYLQEHGCTRETFRQQSMERFLKESGIPSVTESTELRNEPVIEPVAVEAEDVEEFSDISEVSDRAEENELQSTSEFMQGQQLERQACDFLSREDVSELFLQAVKRNFLRKKKPTENYKEVPKHARENHCDGSDATNVNSNTATKIQQRETEFLQGVNHSDMSENLIAGSVIDTTQGPHDITDCASRAQTTVISSSGSPTTNVKTESLLDIQGVGPQHGFNNRTNVIQFVPYEFGRFDRARSTLERQLGATIYWWGCDPPLTPELGPNLVKMIWKCNICGQHLSNVIRQDTIKHYKALYQCVMAGTGINTPQYSEYSNTKPQSSAVSPPLATVEPTAQATTGTINIEVQNTVPSQRVIPTVKNQHFRMMCCIPETEKASLLAQLPKGRAQLTSDEQFFKDLRKEYRNTRGWWRRTFGLSSVKRVTFGKFTRIRLERDYVDCGTEGIPGPSDAEYVDYHFIPKPPQPEQRILDFKLLHYFENPRCLKSPTAADFLMEIPKRDCDLPDHEHLGWGVRLHLFLSLRRLLGIYMAILFLLWLPAWAFFGWWLKKYPQDLQNAAVPVTLITAMLTILFTLLPLHFMNLEHASRK